MLISEKISKGKNYATIEDGNVKMVLNEETKRTGYMPISEAKEFAHSIIDALNKKEQMNKENDKDNK